MKNISLPNKVEFKIAQDGRKGTVIIEPCYPGYGTTLGNAFRRILLSSLPGAAVIAVKIKGVQHEFSAIPKVQEDVVEIILNLKELRLKVFSEEEVVLKLKAAGEREILAKDIEANAAVEIINPDLHLLKLTDKDAEVEMELYVSQGRGYLPTENRDKEKLEVGLIAVDAIFTPVRNVGYKIDNVRVGEITDYDRLTLTIETDGTITPKDAIQQTAQILIDHFSLVGDIEIKPPVDEEKSKTSEAEGIPEDTAEVKPKNKTEGKITDVTEKPKKKRGRPPKKKD